MSEPSSVFLFGESPKRVTVSPILKSTHIVSRKGVILHVSELCESQSTNVAEKELDINEVPESPSGNSYLKPAGIWSNKPHFDSFIFSVMLYPGQLFLEEKQFYRYISI